MLLDSVIHALHDHKVKYAIVGGYAVALHGAVRGTVDIDIVITLDLRSIQRTENALNSIGLKSRLPVTADEVFNFRKEYISNRNLTAWSFINPDNFLEIVDIIITEDLNKLHTTRKKMDRLTINVVTINDLIKMKKKSGRKQDIEDINALEKLK